MAILSSFTIWHWLVAALAAGFWLLPTDDLGPRPVVLVPVTAAALSGQPLIAIGALTLGLGVYVLNVPRHAAYRFETAVTAAAAGLAGIGTAAALGAAGWTSWTEPGWAGWPFAALTIAATTLVGAIVGTSMALTRHEPKRLPEYVQAHSGWYALEAAVGALLALVVAAAGLWVCLGAIIVYAFASRSAGRYVSLVQAHKRTVDALSVVTGSSDPYLTGHARRVARYATAAARELKLSRQEQQMLEYAALLHNLGVLEEEWQLGNRPGTLSTEQVEQIRRATLAGADIVARFGYYPAAADCIRFHLEPYEQAPSAPLGARVLAVANALDAMLVRNRWRRSLSLDEAIEQLQKGAGTQFDPAVVDAMAAALSLDPALRQLASEPYSILADQPELGGLRPWASSPAAQAAITVHNTHLQRLFEQSLRLLAATKSHTELILDSLPDAVFTTDLSGEVTFVNEAGVRLSGMAVGQAAGLPMRDVFGQGDAAMDMEQFLESTRANYEAEVRWRSRSGDEYPARVQFARLTDEGEVVGAVARIEDRSEIKRLQEQVQRAERLALLGELAASVAHEIRNPLAIVRGYAEQLPQDVGNQTAMEQSVETILREVDRLDRVIGQLLAFARPTRIEARHIALEVELDRITEKLEPQAQASGVVIERTYSGVPEVFCDDEKLEQVFLNLMINALQAMPDGGTLTVRTQLEPADSGGHQVAVYISDTGPGIPVEQQHQIFQPFFTTRRKGTGLGLAISARILTEHGGRLALVGTGNRGSTFGVWLPA